MLQYSKNIKNPVLVVLLLLGLTGSIIFLPVPIEKQYTCLFHCKFNSDTGACTCDDCKMVSEGFCPSHPNNGHAHLIDLYTQNYAFPWWFSLGLVTIASYGLYRKFKSGRFSVEVKSNKIYHG